VLEDVRLGLGAEARHRPDLAGPGGGLQVVEVRDLYGLVQRRDGLRADALDGRQRVHVDGQLLAERRQFLDLAGLEVLGGLGGDGVAHVVDLGEGVLAALIEERLDGDGVGADALGGVPVGPGLVVDVAGVEVVGHLRQAGRDLRVPAHGPRTCGRLMAHAPAVRRHPCRAPA
jgi:hypothetical protein